MKTERRDKQLYRQWRNLSASQLRLEVARFDGLSPRDRSENAALVRAAGVVVSELGGAEAQAETRSWMRRLLTDPDEKIRRYAINALPKLKPTSVDESSLLDLWTRSTSDREKKHVTEALAKFGGPATLARLGSVQRIEATLARAESETIIQLDRPLRSSPPIEISLRTRTGLEIFVRDEVLESRRFKITATQPALVRVTASGPFSLSDLYTMRCFGTAGFSVGGGSTLAELAAVIASPRARQIFETFTSGPVRYRLDFAGKGHQRAAVKELAAKVYSAAPQLLNGGGQAPWTIEIRDFAGRQNVELVPRLVPDPRFAYRQQDVPAASHPQLAAALARLAGRVENDQIWDPFCGSGLEIIERSLRGGVSSALGTDLSAEAIEITRKNASAAGIQRLELIQCDFREVKNRQFTLIITNPPLGKRVPIKDLNQLIHDLFQSAARMLKPGGRLVLANPLHAQKHPEPSLKLIYKQVVDFGGFRCRIEKSIKK